MCIYWRINWWWWLGGRKGIWPVKKERWGAGWSEVQTCIWPSWCHCHSLSLASVKSTLVLPFWYRLTCHLDSPGKRAVKRVCVCVEPCMMTSQQDATCSWNLEACSYWSVACTQRSHLSTCTCCPCSSSATNLLHVTAAVDRCDRQTDRQMEQMDEWTPDCYTNPAPHTTQETLSPISSLSHRFFLLCTHQFQMIVRDTC